MLTRQDIEERDRRARQRPPWTRRTRQPLLHADGLSAGLAVLSPAGCLALAWQYAAGHLAHGWARLAGIPVLLLGALIVVLDVLYVRRPTERSERQG